LSRGGGGTLVALTRLDPMNKAVHDRPAHERRTDGPDPAELDAFESRVAGLATPLGYTVPVERVQVVRTAGAALFLTEDRVYKLKRPAGFFLVDESGPEARRRSCEEEVRLNRRISPGVYLGVVPVTRESDGRILLQGKGRIVDWAIEMVRLPADRMLAHLLEHGGVARSQLEKVAFVLARFHERAMTGPEINEHGLPTSIAAETRAGFEELRELCVRHPEVLDEAEIDFLEERSLGFIEQNRELLERRVALWRIRDGHGDLNAGNICLSESGVVVYDCEVDQGRRVRFGDVARDMALLVLDLDDRGNALEAEILVDACSRLSPDDDLEHLVGFYRLQRALERTRSLLRSVAETVSTPSESVTRARRIAQLALGYELDGGLVIVCGTEAAERVELARYLATRLRAVLLTGDPALLEHHDEDDAGQHENGGIRPTLLRVQREYHRLLDAAAGELDRGRAVVVEASFARAAFRRPFVEMGGRTGRPISVMQLGAADDEPPDASEVARVLRLDFGLSVEDGARALFAALLERAADDQELSERPIP
jgi:aminoglycoside phosphotransferase family enzyme